MLLPMMFALAMAVLPGAGRADAALPSGEPAKVTSTVDLGPIVMRKDDLRATQKENYVHMVVDLFPYREAIKAAGSKASPVALAKAVVVNVLQPAYPTISLFKVVLAEFPERDDYDAPRWDKINVLGRYEAHKKGKGWVVQAEKPVAP